TKQKVTCIKDVEDLEVRIEKLEEIFSYLRNKKLKQKEVILGTDDETSSNDDTSSNDEISSKTIALDIVYPHSHVASSVMGTNRTGKAHYGLRSLGPLKEEMVHVKKRYKHDEFPADDEMFMEIDEVVFKIHTKGYFEYDPLSSKEKVIEDEGICSKGNKADVTIYKRAMVNGKAKMVEDVGVVKRGKDRGVVIEDGGFINDRGKETVVTKRKKCEGGV
ncbi:hypothetical protein Tco_0950388, partial [Tanacetum coccineum]